jgi:hypothetical protein
MHLRDDRETEQIGKLIDSGYPELAASTLRSRWRYRLAARAVALLPLLGAAAWHWSR